VRLWPIPGGSPIWKICWVAKFRGFLEVSEISEAIPVLDRWDVGSPYRSLANREAMAVGLKIFGGCCYFCGRKIFEIREGRWEKLVAETSVEHIVPQVYFKGSERPHKVPGNLIPTHLSCNRAKKDAFIQNLDLPLETLLKIQKFHKVFGFENLELDRFLAIRTAVQEKLEAWAASENSNQVNLPNLDELSRRILAQLPQKRSQCRPLNATISPEEKALEPMKDSEFIETSETKQVSEKLQKKLCRSRKLLDKKIGKLQRQREILQLLEEATTSEAFQESRAQLAKLVLKL